MPVKTGGNNKPVFHATCSAGTAQPPRATRNRVCAGSAMPLRLLTHLQASLGKRAMPKDPNFITAKQVHGIYLKSKKAFHLLAPWKRSPSLKAIFCSRCFCTWIKEVIIVPIFLFLISHLKKKNNKNKEKGEKENEIHSTHRGAP